MGMGIKDGGRGGGSWGQGTSESSAMLILWKHFASWGRVAFQIVRRCDSKVDEKWDEH